VSSRATSEKRARRRELNDLRWQRRCTWFCGMVTVHHILVPVDFGADSDCALEYAVMLAGNWDASLHLLHVIRGPLGAPETLTATRTAACARLEALLTPAARDARHVVTSCAVGTTAEEIVRYATEHAIDLIVMGTHRHGPTVHMTTGSIAEAVVARAPCAVLAVKAAPDHDRFLRRAS
jgi:glycine betaine transporter